MLGKALCDWSAILADAVAKPGLIAEAYHRFWEYSIGNQLLASFQCHSSSLEPGPINTFLGWKALGRIVRKGEKALTLCMPITVRARHANAPEEESTANGNVQTLPSRRTVFTYKSRWFVLSQTDGEPYHPTELPEWSETTALSTLDIRRIDFGLPDGNAQGYATARLVSVSPIAFEPHRTLFHELAHVVLGHTTDADRFDDGAERTPRNIREVEAEGVALICCESLGFDGAEFSRGYIQHWLGGQTIAEQSVHRIFKAADTILKAGRPAIEKGKNHV